MALKLSAAQTKNLKALESGPVTFSTLLTRVHSRNNPRSTTASGSVLKADRKGFHITALRSLVKKGLVSCVHEDKMMAGFDTGVLGTTFFEEETFTAL